MKNYGIKSKNTDRWKGSCYNDLSAENKGKFKQ